MSLSSRSSSSGGSSAGGSRQVQHAPISGYYAYRHPVGGDSGGIEQVDYMSSSSSGQRRNNKFKDNGAAVNRKMSAVDIQTGGLNLHIPCAFSYAYNVPVPPQPEYRTRSSKAPSVRSGKDNKDRNSVPPQPEYQTRSSIAPSVRSGEDNKDSNKQQQLPKHVKRPSVPSTKPFVATVKSGQLYKAKKVPNPQNTKTKAKTSVVWDFHAGEKVPFQAVDYGQELYEQAAQNLAQQLQQQKIADGKKSSQGSNSTDIEDNCFDFSKPGINSSRYTSRALEKAVEDLKKLPSEVETLLRKDKRFEPVVTSRATRALNVSRNSRIYKDLIPVDPNPDVRTEAEHAIQAEIKRSIEAARQPSKVKDPEPKLEDFQTNSYTRIRPAAVPPPPKPTSGISVEANHDFDTIVEERLLEDESNRVE